MNSFETRLPASHAPTHHFDSLSDRVHKNPYINPNNAHRVQQDQHLDQHYSQVDANFDQTRTPKLASILLLFSMSFAAVYHTIYGFEYNAIAKSASLHSTELIQPYLNYTHNHTLNVKSLIREMSMPNLDMKGNEVILPIQLVSNLADVRESFDIANDVPIFWHIPRSGGSLMINTAAYCMDLTQASNIGALIDPELAAFERLTTVVDTSTGAKFINVDTASPEGLYKARNKVGDLASYPDLDLIITPYWFDAVELLLNYQNRGRMFVMMRHPIERAESMFHSLKARVETGAIVGDSLLNYAKGQMLENNWMTRFLCNKLGGQLTADDLALAKEVLRTKALVGLLKRKQESYQRFKDYYGWTINDSDPKKVECEEKYLEWGWAASKYTPVEKNSEEWNLLKKANTFDLRLYDYAEKLFQVQGSLFDDTLSLNLNQDSALSSKQQVPKNEMGKRIAPPDAEVMDTIDTNQINIPKENNIQI